MLKKTLSTSPSPKKRSRPRKKKCLQCSTEFLSTGLSAKQWKAKKFCSRECNSEHKRAGRDVPASKTCHKCGSEYVKPTDLAIDVWANSRFCSTECRGAFKATAEGREEARHAKLTSTAAHEPAAPEPDAFNTPALAPLAKELASRVLARRSLLHFTKKTHPDYQAGWVHADICARLERFSRQVIAKQSPRLMLLMPPRHGKSELASIRFPGWHLGQAPEHEVINVGYNLDLPMKFSRKVREMLRDPLYRAIFSNTILDPESQSVEAWNTTSGGGFQAAGVGGGITGKGAHVLIVDDPIKNMQEADSALTRETLWDWYLSTAYTRLSPGGGVLVIETWWNDDDLAGRLQQAMFDDPLTDQFEIIKYPALAEAYEFRQKETLEIVRLVPQVQAGQTPAPALDLPPGLDWPTGPAVDGRIARLAFGVAGVPSDDIVIDAGQYELLRVPGEALHRARYDEVSLNRIKSVQAPRIWSALYQQNPVPDEGLYFRKEYIKTAPNIPQTYGLRVYTAWDFAIATKQANDWTVGATILQDYDDNLYVIDIVRFKGDTFTIVESILDAAERWAQPNVPYLIGFEDGQIFKALLPLLEKRMKERKQFPSYEILRPLSDKMARARSLQGRMQQGRVYFPDQAPWRQDAVHELLRFPGGVHDDIVDALAWAVNLVVGKAAPTKPEPKGLKSWKDKLSDLFVLDGTHMSA